MTGGLVKNRGKYYARLYFLDENGKRKPKLVSLHMEVKGNAKRAKEALNKLLAEYNAKYTDVYHEDVLFSDYLKKWLNEKRPSIEVSTYEGYQSYIDLHIHPYFDGRGVKLQDLNYQHLQDYYDEKHKTLSANSLKHHHAVINQALKAAIKHRIIRHNPAAEVTLPKVEKYVGKFLTTEEGTLLLKAARDTPMETLVILGMMYGLRRSEIAGLKWSAIDFKKNTMTIRHTVVRQKSTVAKDRTKTESSYRILPLNKEVKAYLLKLRARQAQDKLFLGKAYQDTEYVCRWPDGHAMDCSYLSDAFKKLLVKNELPVIRLHDLRHSCASYMLMMGCNVKEIQEWLGHSDISTTMKYVHLDMEAKKNVAERFAAQFSLGV